jgi:hypothetical protein
MSAMKTAVAITLVLLVTICIEGSPPVEKSPKVAGTYSNLAYNDDSGDLNGMEIKIVPMGDGYLAAILVSEGEPQRFEIVKVNIVGTSVTFSVARPESSGFSFSGRLNAKALTGIVRYKQGGQERVSFARRCGYWDK